MLYLKYLLAVLLCVPIGMFMFWCVANLSKYINPKGRADRTGRKSQRRGNAKGGNGQRYSGYGSEPGIFFGSDLYDGYESEKYSRKNRSKYKK